MLTTQTLKADLERRLAAHGFDPKRPELAPFWAAWREQCQEAVEGMGLPEEIETDKLLFESSLDLRVPPDWEYEASGPAFRVSFTRQFIHEDEDGEYGGMEGLHASFTYPPEQVFRDVVTFNATGEQGYGATSWGWPAANCAEWTAEVEAHPTFQAALTQTAQAFEMGQGPY